LLISNACDVVDQQFRFLFFVLEEHPQSVAEIQETKRYWISAEHWHVLKALGCHLPPCGIEIVLKGDKR
jgi:hypothetical protein